MSQFLPLKKSEFREFYAISTQYGRGNNRALQPDNKRPVVMGSRDEGEELDLPNYAKSSPTLQALRDDNRNVHLVQMVSRHGLALSPDMQTTKVHLRELAKENDRVKLWPEPLDIENPLEKPLLDYIQMNEKDPPAVMVWYQGKGAWANGPNMLSTVDQLVDYALE
jgi:hypothetical protein